MSIAFRVGYQYREEGHLNPPSDLTSSELKQWELEAKKILIEELKSA